ncbi:hypothetical protein C440_05887 [Haloferax mucosum ATCC BAA-1512]|uniref:Uncharacterized protein n=1 Tax=Haloferax mucosum ATCC BAA-1512 TaxID=662479 RepID=M0IGA1_9EURY|nr:hypothetical protein C440_05887 [Haloferax mucosum ATCC BAA-1512]
MPVPRSDSEADLGDDLCNVIDSLSQLESKWRLVVLYDLQ